MNGLLKDAVRRAALGLALGALAGVGILWLVQPGAFADGAGRLILAILCSGLYGAAVMGASVVYDIEHWSITRATLTHLFIALGGLYALGLAQGWLTLSVTGFLIPTLAFIAAYCLIWLAQSLTFRRKVRQMNREVRARRTLRSQTLKDQ